MSRVADSSLVLAVIYREKGWEKWLELLEDANLSTVNLAEVQSKLVIAGMSGELAWEAATDSVFQVMLFDEEQARLTGDLIVRTREFGLSLGDRACLALGMVLGMPVYTADRSWERLKVGVKIHVIR
jgi:PIN domain nuclease of toxin-antitoxin system